MNARAPLSQGPESAELSREGCATVQKPPRRLLKDLSAALVEDDKTVRVDLSGLAQAVKGGGEPGELLNEAPTRRYSGARPQPSERPYCESSPAGAVPRVASGVRKLTLPPPLPTRPIVPPPSMRASRGAVAQDEVASASVQKKEATRSRHPRPQRVDGPAIRILRGMALFAWGFSAATVLWLALDRHPQWRAGVVDRFASLWSAHFARP